MSLLTPHSDVRTVVTDLQAVVVVSPAEGLHETLQLRPTQPQTRREGGLVGGPLYHTTPQIGDYIMLPYVGVDVDARARRRWRSHRGGGS